MSKPIRTIVRPVETAPASWLAKRDQAEAKLGVKLVKFFCKGA